MSAALRDFDALVAYVRDMYSATEWLHDMTTLQRRMVATAAAAFAGTGAIEPDTVVVRNVYNALIFPPRVSVLLGVGTCPECDEEMQGDDCPNRACVMNAPRAAKGRDWRGWVRNG